MPENESTSTGSGATAGNGHSPYQNPALNGLYNLLFCDDLDAFRGASEGAHTEPWATLFAADADTGALRAIAEDDSMESRVRILAYNRLREAGAPVAEKELLGVIFEVEVGEGLDVLAAYADGRVRFINHAEQAAILEEPFGDVAEILPRLFALSSSVVSQIGPWDQPRPAPPTSGMMRINFLVSDGHYFGQGPQNVLQSDGTAGPIINAGIQLMDAVVRLQRQHAH